MSDRVIRYRLRPGSAARAVYLARVAGAARKIWNERIALNQKAVADGESPLYGYYAMCEWFTAFRRDPPPEWRFLRECPTVVVRQTLKDLGDSYAQAVKGDNVLRDKFGWDGRDSTRAKLVDKARAAGLIVRGWPRFKARASGDDGFWIPPGKTDLKDGRIRVPRPVPEKGEKRSPALWVKLDRRGGDPYAECRPKQARVRRERGKWFCHVWFDAPENPAAYARDAIIGVDRNCGIAGLSAPIVFAGRETQTPEMPTARMAKLLQRRKRYERKMSRKRDDALLRVRGWNGKANTRKAKVKELDGETRKAAEVKLGKIVAARVRRWRKVIYDGRHSEWTLAIARRALEREGKPATDAAVRAKRHRLAEARMMKYGRRYEIAKGRAAKASAKLARVRENWAHHLSRALAESVRVVALEDLKIVNLTRAAKGTAEKPGRNVRAKAGLNRAILNSGWRKLASALEYKAAETALVPAAYTSRDCSVCGWRKANLKLSARRWRCGGCGATHHRDINAGINIAGKAAEAVIAKRARGLGAVKAREAAPPILAVRPELPGGARAETRTKTFA